MATKVEESGTLAEALASKLRRQIQESELVEGDFFMTESDLAATYEVSRTVAREAVGRLKSLGMLEGRKRKGLIVRRPDPLRLLTQTLPSLISSESDLRELGMFRYALEVGSIELAIQHATEEQLGQLAQIVADMEVACARDVERARTMIRIHCTEWFKNASDDESISQPDAGA